MHSLQYVADTSDSLTVTKLVWKVENGVTLDRQVPSICVGYTNNMQNICGMQSEAKNNLLIKANIIKNVEYEYV